MGSDVRNYQSGKKRLRVKSGGTRKVKILDKSQPRVDLDVVVKALAATMVSSSGAKDSIDLAFRSPRVKENIAPWVRSKERSGDSYLDLGPLVLEVTWNEGEDAGPPSRPYRWTAADTHSGIFYARKEAMKLYWSEADARKAAETWALKLVKKMLAKLVR
jgi:hypothetical protein